MKDLKCSVHGTKLVEKEVPVFYGMPTADSDISELDTCIWPEPYANLKTQPNIRPER